MTGLQDGDEVTSGFWVYDQNSTASYPKGRIYGYYTTDAGDVESYGGSASGNDTYSDQGWTYLEYTWEFDSDGGIYGTRNGLVIEARFYSAFGDTIYIDNLTITAAVSIWIHRRHLPQFFSINGIAMKDRSIFFVH